MPGKTEGDYYVISIVYTGEGRFNGHEIEDKHPRTIGDVTYWDNVEKTRVSAMNAGLVRIQSDDKFNSLEELADGAFGNGMSDVAKAFPYGSRYNDKSDSKADSGV